MNRLVLAKTCSLNSNKYRRGVSRMKRGVRKMTRNTRYNLNKYKRGVGKMKRGVRKMTRNTRCNSKKFGRSWRCCRAPHESRKYEDHLFKPTLKTDSTLMWRQSLSYYAHLR